MSEVEKNSAEEQNTPIEEERVVVFEEGLEAVLFAAGHPVSYATLARVFEMTPSKVKDKIFEYAIKYNDPKPFPRGVMLLTYADSCQLCTKENYLHEIRDALGIRKSGSLSTAAMETLAVVAYNQPVTRVFVDTIRKVDSSYAMNSLIDRGLIECVGRLDVPGRPMQYGTTSDFLRCFGLKSIEELPTASEDLANMFEKTKEKEEAERNADEDQITISELETESEISKTETEASEANADEEKELTEESTETNDNNNFDDEPSAEDDIVDVE
ncbi:MAG: SMC-Scp complex subunit ScpB [Ruminococcaceae bacterium]|nr:SMC-Scp complex subunit ScpB [Oscillospiraceae bacterium]